MCESRCKSSGAPSRYHFATVQSGAPRRRGSPCAGGAASSIQKRDLYTCQNIGKLIRAKFWLRGTEI